jgi:CysZ protein
MAEQAQNPFFRGFRLALEGMKTAFRSREVRRAYLEAVAIIFVLGLGFAAAAIWALWTYGPPEPGAALWLVITLWIACVVGTLLALLLGPLLAIFVVNIAFPFFNVGVFMAGMRVIDPERAAGLEGKPGMPMAPAAGIATRRLLKFLLLSVVFFAIGLIPVVGTILGTVGELLLAARTIAWELLDPYFDILDIRYAEQKEIVARHKRALLGFGLPVSLMLGIPLVGPFLFGLAQVAGAAFVASELPVDPREGDEAG